jgi:hypothetical protein
MSAFFFNVSILHARTATPASPSTWATSSIMTLHRKLLTTWLSVLKVELTEQHDRERLPGCASLRLPGQASQRERLVCNHKSGVKFNQSLIWAGRRASRRAFKQSPVYHYSVLTQMFFNFLIHSYFSYLDSYPLFSTFQSQGFSSWEDNQASWRPQCRLLPTGQKIKKADGSLVSHISQSPRVRRNKPSRWTH